MVQYTSRKGLPYPETGDDVKIASRDLRDLAWGVDAEIASTEARLGSDVADTRGQVAAVDRRVNVTNNRIDSSEATTQAKLDAQQEEYEQLLNQVATAYDVAVAQGFAGTPSQWLESLRGDQGREGPYGGTSVTDPQVASMVSADTATAAALRDGFVERHGTRGQTRTLYVRATGDDSNNGRTPESAFREIRTAVASLEQEMPELRGSVIIDVGPGLYEGGVRLPVTRTPAQDAFLTIKGPDVGGHPNVPTAIISHEEDTTATWGILAENGWWLWVEDIKIQGAFNTGLDCRSDVTLQRRNVHIDGCSIGVNVTSRVMDNARGGIVENCTLYGVQEMYHVVRTYMGPAGQGTLYRNNKYGLFSKSLCGGHGDYAEYEGNDVAIHLDGSRINLLGVHIRDSRVVGLSLRDGEAHNIGSVTWSGNTRRMVTYGNASSIGDLMGWTNDAQETLRAGYTPPLMLRQMLSPITVTGTTSSTTVASFAGALAADRYTLAGMGFRIKLIATTNATLSGSVNIRLLVGSIAIASTIPEGSGGSIDCEFEMVCTEDGNNQLYTSRLITQNGDTRVSNRTQNYDLTSASRSAIVNVSLSDPSDWITVHAVQLFG